MTPKVSIVIPVYNGSNYLKEAIDSALAQTYKNIEIVVVNDGSNDEGATEQIAKSYGKKIRYYSKKNGGVATALNLGIEKMTGEYFSWLSHDDMYYKDKIEKQVELLGKINFKKVFLYSNYAILQDELITPVRHSPEVLRRKPEYGLLRGCINGITLLIPKSFFDEFGKFDEALRCTQDYDYWMKIQSNYEFIHMPDVLSITRLHSAQDSVVSPRVVSEGNELWTRMIEAPTDKRKAELEGTIFNYYFELSKFLKTTPYGGALKHCEEQLLKYEKLLDKENFSPKVSVVIPFYNRVDNTIRALESVRKQTYKNLEAVLVNDCSTEDIEKIKDWVSKNGNFKLINTTSNSGPATARNLGIKAAKGQYIAFLDSDDEFLPKKIEKQMLAMKKHNRELSYTAYLRYSRNLPPSTVRDVNLSGIIIPRAIDNCNIATPTVIIKKSIIIDEKNFFDEKYRIGEDTCLWLKLAKAHEFLLVEEPLTKVYAGEESHFNSTGTSLKGMKNIIRYLLNDQYYSEYNSELSILCRYVSEMSQTLSESEFMRVKRDGPVRSTDLKLVKPLESKTRSGYLKTTIPYRAVRKIYRSSRSRISKTRPYRAK